ncbi:hypothetical protein PoB_007350500 [Plakobranchus ocellatus]|uniref:Uncharacterized protein n=1 Tax=Plakobranchus ocellatus TaxID=259542 RepID=A0AAV4DSN6_9GAST|nr:hypothetical protein PoB_007350500 [Plakobranchus ocellatus]
MSSAYERIVDVVPKEQEHGVAEGTAMRNALRYRLTSPQQGDLRFSGPPSGQGAGGGARTRNRRVPSDLRADSLATVPPTPHELQGSEQSVQLISQS